MNPLAAQSCSHAGRWPGVLLALIPGRYHLMAARLNALASFVTLASGLTLFMVRPEPTLYFFIDDFNVYLVVLTAFVGFTTSVFSASYIDHELEIGRLDAARLRFYHAHVPGLHVQPCCWRWSPTISASCGWRSRARRWRPR